MSTTSEAIDTSTLPARLPKGFEIEDYVVDGWVRDGGMASIYRAHRRSDGERVALKLQLPSTVHLPQLCVRFDREAEALERVRGSDAVVELFATDRLSDGRRYFLIEWVDGDDLEEQLDFLRNQDERLSVARACSIGAGIARGLAEVHAADLVHRDLKPANVMVGRSDEDDVVKLVDFGIVADLREDGPDEEVMGTSAYMAPEQAEGHPATAAMDLFALGVVMYEALTGTCVPPDGWTPESLPAVETLRRSVPIAVADLVRECMRSDPRARPISAADVAARLEAHATEQPHPSSAHDGPVRTGRTTLAPRADLVALPSVPAQIEEDTETRSTIEASELATSALAAPAPALVHDAHRHRDTDGDLDSLAGDGSPRHPTTAARSGAHPVAAHSHHALALGVAPDSGVLLPARTGETEIALTVEDVMSRSGVAPPYHDATVVVPAPTPKVHEVRERSGSSGSRRRGLLLLFAIVTVLGVGLGAAMAIGGRSSPTSSQTESMLAVEAEAPPSRAPSGEDSVPNEPTTSPPMEADSLPLSPSPEPDLPERPSKSTTIPPSDDTSVPTTSAPSQAPSPAECSRTRASAETAKANRDWVTVVKTTKSRACWKGRTKSLTRRRLRVEAFAETRNYSRCVKEGGKSKDPQVVRRVTWCSGRLAG